MDERGYLRITDRMKDMFIVGGFNCYPAEIENLLLEHPGVGQVAVIGIPDERMGEVGMAFVVPRPRHADPTEAEIIAWAARAHGQLQGAAPRRDRRRPADEPRRQQGRQERPPSPRLTPRPFCLARSVSQSRRTRIPGHRTGQCCDS